MKKLFASLAASVAVGVAVPAFADAPRPSLPALQQGIDPLAGFTPAQQDDLRLAVEDVCADWLADSGSVCTAEQQARILRFVADFTRSGNYDVQAYRDGIADIFGRFPRDPAIAAHNEAVAVAARFCETNDCGRWQYEQLVGLIKEEILRGRPATEEDAVLRRTALLARVSRIMAQDPNVRPADMETVIIGVDFAPARERTVADEAAWVCGVMAEHNQIPCTSARVAAVTALITRLDAQVIVTERQTRARRQEYMRAMQHIFSTPAVTVTPAMPRH